MNPRRRRADTDYWRVSREVLTAAAQGKPIRDFLEDVGLALWTAIDVDALEIWLMNPAGNLRCSFVSATSDPAWLPWPAAPGSEYEAICLAALGKTGLPGPCRSHRGGIRVGPGPGDAAGSGSAERNGQPDPSGMPILLCLPFNGSLQPGDDEKGLLVLQSLDQGRFRDSEVELLVEVVASLGRGVVDLRTHASLRERVKELTCLYRIALLVEQPGNSLDDTLQGLVEILPEAWLYPQHAWARLEVDGRSYSTERVNDSWPRLRAEVQVGGATRGILEAGYSVQMPNLHEGPFLREERSLLETVAREVALVVERRDIEKKSRELQEQLMHADRLATIGELASGIAHELNEPLNSILGFAQLAEKCSGLPAQASRDLERIVDSALHTREVIQQLLLFARRMPQRLTSIDLSQQVQQTQSFLQALCAKARIELVFQLAAGLPAVLADPDQIRQVLVNLVVNSSQAMGQGGTLTIGTALDLDEEYACLSVEDTGSGIPKEDLDRIFLPFFTSREGGTGLGLSVVHGIVSSHGGFIRVRSELGKGSRFEVQLPLETREAVSRESGIEQ